VVEPWKYALPSTSKSVPSVVVALPPRTRAILLPPFGESVRPFDDVANLEFAPLLPDPVPHATPVLESTPVDENVAHPAVPPAELTMRFVVDAVVAERVVVVALEVVELSAVKFRSVVEPETNMSPELLIENRVVVAKEATDESWKRGAVSLFAPATSRRASGDEVPRPSWPIVYIFPVVVSHAPFCDAVVIDDPRATVDENILIVPPATLITPELTWKNLFTPPFVAMFSTPSFAVAAMRFTRLSRSWSLPAILTIPVA
jgi:hypothetical protein